MKKKEALKNLKHLVEHQACDEGLWFVATTAPESYLQQELRKLHELCEVVIRHVEGQDKLL